MTDPTQAVYVYAFVAWPHEHGHPPEVYTLFDMLKMRVEMEFTEERFGLFRAGLERAGFTLREVTRVPYHEPEIVR